MVRKEIIGLLVIFCLPQLLKSQSITALLNAGNDEFRKGNYYAASWHFAKVMEKDSNDLNTGYQLAESARLNSDYHVAWKWYNFVEQKDKKEEFKKAIFYGGVLAKNLGNYVEAKRLFSLYYKKNYNDDDYFTKKAKQEIDACEYALVLLEDTVKMEVTNLGDPVNTTDSEFAALRNSDTTLFFSALRPEKIALVWKDPYEPRPEEDSVTVYRAKIYQAAIKDGKIVRTDVLDTLYNSSIYHNANLAISTDKRTIYFTRCHKVGDTSLQCQIYYRKLVNGRWLPANLVCDKVNLAGYSATHPAITFSDSDGDLLYFSSDRPGGYGKMDIWASTIQKDGSCSNPINLGATINSIDDEITPFFHYNTQTLYFSSDWHKGLGGFDIFKSKRKTIYWSAPKNLGIPYNSSYNDLYYTTNNDANKGYITSNRIGSQFEKNENCCNDIYYFALPKVEIIEISKLANQNVNLVPVRQTGIPDVKSPAIFVEELPERKEEVAILEDMKNLLPISLYFHNDEPDPKTTSTKTRKDYLTTYQSYSYLKDIYKIEFSKGLEGEEANEAMKAIEDFFEDYVELGYKNLDKFTNYLLDLLSRNRKVKVTLKGYCSPLNSTEYNQKLAKRRISSLMNYIYIFKNKAFEPYLHESYTEGRQLQIVEEPIGELPLTEGLSDDPNDVRNSVFSPLAARERKIEILMVEFEDD